MNEAGTTDALTETMQTDRKYISGSHKSKKPLSNPAAPMFWEKAIVGNKAWLIQEQLLASSPSYSPETSLMSVTTFLRLWHNKEHSNYAEESSLFVKDLFGYIEAVRLFANLITQNSPHVVFSVFWTQPRTARLQEGNLFTFITDHAKNTGCITNLSGKLFQPPSNLQKINSHVLHCDVFKDLTVVNIPHSLVIPNFGSQ